MHCPVIVLRDKGTRRRLTADEIWEMSGDKLMHYGVDYVMDYEEGIDPEKVRGDLIYSLKEIGFEVNGEQITLYRKKFSEKFDALVLQKYKTMESDGNFLDAVQAASFTRDYMYPVVSYNDVIIEVYKNIPESAWSISGIESELVDVFDCHM